MKQLIGLVIAATVLTPLATPAQDKNPVVVVETSLGKFKIELYPKKAPESVKNFLAYVDAKHYDGTIFHRVIPTFMIQGGGFTADMQQKPTKDPIKNESANGLTNDKYTVAMARTPQPHSATSQFFVNVKDNPFLNKANAEDGWGYTVFGKVISGQDVVDKIRDVPTGTKKVQIGAQMVPFQNVPNDPVVIKSIRLEK